MRTLIALLITYISSKLSRKHMCCCCHDKPISAYMGADVPKRSGISLHVWMLTCFCW